MQLQSTSPSFITPSKTLLHLPSSSTSSSSSCYSNTVTNHWFIHLLYTDNSLHPPEASWPTHSDINTPTETLHLDLLPKNTRPTLLTLLLLDTFPFISVRSDIPAPSCRSDPGHSALKDSFPSFETFEIIRNTLESVFLYCFSLCS